MSDDYATIRADAERMIGRPPDYERDDHASWNFDADPGAITLEIGVSPVDFSVEVRLYSMDYALDQPDSIREAVDTIKRTFNEHAARCEAAHRMIDPSRKEDCE